MATVDFTRGEYDEFWEEHQTGYMERVEAATDVDQRERFWGELHRVRSEGALSVLMERANNLFGSHGVEATFVQNGQLSHHSGELVATYLNMGDTYAWTLLLEDGTFHLTSWGDFVERWEREHPRLCPVCDERPAEYNGDSGEYDLPCATCVHAVYWRPDPKTLVVMLRSNEGNPIAVHAFVADESLELGFSVPSRVPPGEFLPGDHVCVRATDVGAARWRGNPPGLSYEQFCGEVREGGHGWDVVDVRVYSSGADSDIPRGGGRRTADPFVDIPVYSFDIEPSPAFEGNEELFHDHDEDPYYRSPWTSTIAELQERGLNRELPGYGGNYLSADQWERLFVAVDSFMETGMKYQPVAQFLKTP